MRTAKPISKKLIVATLLAVLILSYYLYFERAASKVNNLEPRELVQTYYKSIAAHNTTMAKACLEPSYRVQIVGSDDWDGRNVLLLWNIQISQPQNVLQHSSNYEDVQLTAQYDVTYKKIITEYSGHSIRFIYVSKKTANSPWKISSIGTGP